MFAIQDHSNNIQIVVSKDELEKAFLSESNYKRFMNEMRYYSQMKLLELSVLEIHVDTSYRKR